MAFGFDDSNFWAWWSAPPFALVDGGMAPVVQLIMPLLPNGVHFDPRLGLLLMASALVLTLLSVLSITIVILRRQGLLGTLTHLQVWRRRVR
jgi:hypothetical protein